MKEQARNFVGHLFYGNDIYPVTDVFQEDGTWTDIPRCIEHDPGVEEQVGQSTLGLMLILRLALRLRLTL